MYVFQTADSSFYCNCIADLSAFVLQKAFGPHFQVAFLGIRRKLGGSLICLENDSVDAYPIASLCHFKHLLVHRVLSAIIYFTIFFSSLMKFLKSPMIALGTGRVIMVSFGEPLMIT